MGYGDELMATGLARGAHARGKRVAFGDGKSIIWSQWAPEVFMSNPNIARPWDKPSDEWEWCEHYVGHRLYNKLAPDRSRWIWNLDFRATPGEMFFGPKENARRIATAPGFVVIEPNVPPHKPMAVNKQWPLARFQAVADALTHWGFRPAQIIYGGSRHTLERVELFQSDGFRDMCAILSRASLYIGHEGGMHHAAAAVRTLGVVIFGGCVPAQSLGYPTHHNLTGNATEACGSLKPCDHCRRALDAITVDEVLEYAVSLL